MSTPCSLAVVAGSGLDLRGIFDSINEERQFAETEGLPQARVKGHDGRFVFGRSEGQRVVLQCGRLHFYEGRGFASATSTLDALHHWGVRTLLLTNAAGGLLPEMRPGDLLAADEIRRWPCRLWPELPEVLTPDIVPRGCDWRGAYHWVHGPCYETRAEIAALRSLGSSAVGMSTAPEAHRARELGVRVAAISCITNNCCTPQVLTHEHVLQTAAAASARLCALLREVIREGAALEHARAG